MIFFFVQGIQYLFSILFLFPFVWAFNWKQGFAVSGIPKNVTLSHRKVLDSCLSCAVTRIELIIWTSGTFFWDRETFFMGRPIKKFGLGLQMNMQILIITWNWKKKAGTVHQRIFERRFCVSLTDWGLLSLVLFSSLENFVLYVENTSKQGF